MHRTPWLCLLAAAPLLSNASNTTWNLQKHTIEAPGIRASYIAYGARLTNLFVPDKNGVFRDVVRKSIIRIFWLNRLKHLLSQVCNDRVDYFIYT